MKPTVRIILFTLTATLMLASALFPQKLYREVKKSDEKKVRVHIESSFGSVNIKKGPEEKIVAVYYRRKEKNRQPRLELDYFVRKGTGELFLEMHPEGSERTSSDGTVHVNADMNFNSDEWYVELAEGIPLSINAELGAGKSDFDFTGLTIDDLTIATGASSSKVYFGEKNKGEIRTLKIESGVSKFSATKLNNANFRRLQFEGGVGSYYLDFGGELETEVNVNINVGLGALTLAVPRSIGVRITYEDSWLSHLSLDNDEFNRMRKGIYESVNFDSSKGKMIINIESGLGSVKVRRTKE